MFEKLKEKSLRLNQRVLFISSEFKVKEIHENGEITLASMSKNIDDRTIRAKDVRYCYPSTDIGKKRFSLPME